MSTLSDPSQPTVEVPSLADHRRTPFIDDMLEETGVMSFHMPGHKGDPGLIPRLAALVGEEMFANDVVSIRGNIDYLHAPQASLAEAERLMADAYGADRSFFLINGSTVGNVAAIWAMASDGERVIVPRSSHRSVYGGLVVSGAAPLYIEPLYHPQVGYPIGTSVERVQALLEAHPEARGIHITAPNYYGYIADVAAITGMAHRRGIPLAVDEAHGAHLAFHPDLPETAVRLGADMVVQSMHKTLGALTQASLLHYNAGLVDLSRLTQGLAILQSSSPNSPLLASLDAARMHMMTDGRALLDRAVALSHMARESIRRIPGLWCYGDELVGAGGVHTYDPTKLVIRVTDLGVTGLEASDYLYNKLKILVEFAELRHIICSVTIGDTEERVNHLLAMLRVMADDLRRPFGITAGGTSGEIDAAPGLPEMALSPRQAYFARSQRVPFDQSAGQICAESIIPYPPGIPFVLPGERINAEMIGYLRSIMARGFAVVGPEDVHLDTVRVIVRG